MNISGIVVKSDNEDDDDEAFSKIDIKQLEMQAQAKVKSNKISNFVTAAATDEDNDDELNDLIISSQNYRSNLYKSPAHAPKTSNKLSAYNPISGEENSPLKLNSSQPQTSVPANNSKSMISVNTVFDSQTMTYPYSIDSQSMRELSPTNKKRAKFELDYLRPTYPSTIEANAQYRELPASYLSSTLTSTSSTETTSPDSTGILSQNPSPRSHLNASKFYGLPLKVKELLKQKRKISALYDWQNELLCKMLTRYETALGKLFAGSTNSKELFTNLLYLSPTSAGKTLVAELIILHCLLVRQKNCMFIMPFVSIVQEKVQAIAEFAEELGFYVEEYAGVKGRVPPVKRQLGKHKSTLYICTIEKAHSLVNSLIEMERLADEIGLVVADELHMIGDGPRGAIYEMTLSKVNYCSELILTNNETKGKRHFEKTLPIQIVATTATLQNKNELAAFMKAELYERQFRPVELKEYVKVESQIFEVDKTRLHLNEELENIVKLDRELDVKNHSAELKRDDPDGLVTLIKEVIPEQSCLIFCSTKKNCENLASLLCSYLPSELKSYKRDQKLKLFNELREENSNNICAVLRKSLQFGVAYHHSGLTTEERQLIEQAFRDGVLCLLTCTSTLAAGVNLPAKRVIIRSPYIAMDFISTHQYRQMIGRAGRAGLIDSVGESILVFKNADRLKVLDLISGPMKRCESSFQCDDSKAIRLLVLSLIGLNLTRLGSQIFRFFRQTLFFMQKKTRLDNEEKKRALADEPRETLCAVSVPKEFDLISNALDYLLKKELVRVNSEHSVKVEGDLDGLETLYFSYFEITKLGMAAIKGNVDLDNVHQLYADLKIGLKSMVLSNYLHLLYLCTPYELVNSMINIDFDIYARKNKKVDENVLKRFYLTLVIYELWKTNNAIWKVSSEFNLDRGFIQNTVQSAASFTSGVLHFCEQIDELWPYKNLLDEFTKRLQFNCSSVDLIPLLELDSVRLARAKQLFMAGYTTVESVAAARSDDMCSKVKNLLPTMARRIIKSANKILKERIETLQAEADILMEQLHVTEPFYDEVKNEEIL